MDRALAPESLGQLAEALRNFRRLAVSMHADSDGIPVIDVTGPAGGASVMAGSIHYWWLRHEVAWCERSSRKEDRLMSVT